MLELMDFYPQSIGEPFSILGGSVGLLLESPAPVGSRLWGEWGRGSTDVLCLLPGREGGKVCVSVEEQDPGLPVAG